MPMGIVALFTVMIVASVPPQKLPLKWRLQAGAIVSAGGVLILAWAYNREDYWRLCFPGRSTLPRRCFVFG